MKERDINQRADGQTNEESIEVLNKILKGEQMAIDIYDHYINQLQHQEARNLLEEFKQDHHNHIALLSRRIEELGGTPEEDRGLKVIISKTMMEIGDLLGDESDDNILGKAYEGEKMGIEQVEEKLQEKLDQKSQELVSDIINKDKTHLDQFEQLLNEIPDQ